MTTTSHHHLRAGKRPTGRVRRMARRAAGGAVLASAVTVGAAGPAAAAQSVTASPDSNLADTAFVDVSGTGFGANATLLMYQCADVNSVGHCTDQPIAETELGSSGSFSSVSVAVTAVFTTDLGPTECRTGCRIEVIQVTGVGAGRDSISFSRYASTK